MHNSKVRYIFVDPYHRNIQFDSTSAREDMLVINTLSKAEGMIVVASIHQPSPETLAQFTNVMYLARGAMYYLGRADQLGLFFAKWGRLDGRYMHHSFFSLIRYIHLSDHIITEHSLRTRYELPKPEGWHIFKVDQRFSSFLPFAIRHFISLTKQLAPHRGC